MVLLLNGTLGLLAFAALSWIILLGAVASLHSLYAETIKALPDSDVKPGWIADQLGLAWWMVWYEFFMIVAVGVSVTQGMLKKHAGMFGNFLTALFALQMYIAHEAAIVNRGAESSEVSKLKSRAGAFLAGTIMCMMSTILLIIWLGILPFALIEEPPLEDQKSCPPPASKGIQKTTSGVPDYVSTATGGSEGASAKINAGYAPHHPPGMPAPPAPALPPMYDQGYALGYGQPAPHEAIAPSTTDYHRYGNTSF